MTFWFEQYHQVGAETAFETTNVNSCFHVRPSITSQKGTQFPVVYESCALHAGLVTMMQDADHHQFRSLMGRIWQRLKDPRLSTSSAMTGGRLSVRSMRLRRLLRLRQLCESKKQ